MAEIKNKSVVETLKSRLRAPWVWFVVILTLCLTALFYASQKPQLIFYNQYIKAHAEYQLQEAKMMRSLERVRIGEMADSTLIVSQMMMMREMVVSFAGEMDGLAKLKIKTPPPVAVSRFEREVARKQSVVSWYLEHRRQWFLMRDSLVALVSQMPASVTANLYALLDSASLGYPVVRPERLALPDSLASKVDALLGANADLSVAWNRFDNDVAVACSEELVHFFQMEVLSEISLKSKVPMVFYFLSIVLLLSMFFFIFRSRS